MILFTTASQRAAECVTALHVATNQTTHGANSMHEALGMLRSNEYVVVVIDQCLLDGEPDGDRLLVQHLGPAIPVYVNCALCGVERIVRDVRLALARREIEIRKARQCAEEALRQTLRVPLTAILLNSDLLVEMSNVPANAREKAEAIQEMARQLAAQVEVPTGVLMST